MEKIIPMLEALGNKIGATVQVLWPHQIRYVVFEAVSNVFCWMIVVLIASVLLFNGLKAGKEVEYEDGGWYFPVGIGGIVLFGCLMALATSGPTCIAKIFEPTGYLVNRILVSK